jgi:outer membrane protein OmpA-like peptidoglycan-associated protein
MYLEPEEKLNDHNNTIGYKAQTSSIGTQRYTVGVLASTGAYVSVLAYAISAGPHTREASLRGRTIAVVDIIQPKQREQKMVTINAEEMAGRISTAGSIALYGIYFDFNKSDVKPESGQTLEQIARLMKGKPGMKLLVVGHTDNAGGFSSNMDLSQRRAVAVVNALASRYGADKKRLTPVGVSFACPIASNKSEEGRAKNRRVELVEN